MFEKLINWIKQRKKVVIGFLTVVVMFSAFYVTMNNVRIRVDDDKTTFYTLNENNRFIVSGREYNKLFKGTEQKYRDVNSVETSIEIDSELETVTIRRVTPYKAGPVIIDTYLFSGEIDDVEMFPIYHKVEIINGSGYFYRYEVRDLEYFGETYKLTNETSLSFGKNMKVELNPDYRWAWVYKSGIVKVQYDIKSDYEVFNIRFFDPIYKSILYERTEFSNVYKNCDGTFTAELYGSPINYFNGYEWTPINTTIVLSDEPNYDYEVETGNYHAYFKSDPSTSGTVKFEKNQSVTYQPMFLIYRGDTSQQEISNIYSQSGKGFADKDKFIYPNAFVKGWNLTYQYQTNKLKEELIIPDKSSLPVPESWIGSNVYLELHHLLSYGQNTKMFVNDNEYKKLIKNIGYEKEKNIFAEKHIVFKNERDKPTFFINVPYAVDSVGSRIDLNYSITYKNKKSYIYWQIPYKWLIDEKRVYPVYIDPTTDDATARGLITYDTYLDEDNGNDNKGSSNTIKCGSKDSSNDCWMAMSFNFSSLEATSISSAVIDLQYSSSSGSGYNILAYYCNDADIGGITWNNKDTVQTNCDANSFDTAPCCGDRQWNITSKMSAEISDDQAFSVQFRNDNSGEVDAYTSWLSSDYGTVSDRPRFIVTYTSNTAPDITTPSILPDPAYTDSTLNCTTTYTDADGDTGNVTFTWFKNSVNIYSSTDTNVANGSTSWQTLSSGNFSKSDVIICQAQATDGTDSSSAKNSTSLTISNSPPQVQLNSPSDGATNQSLSTTLNVTVTDDDGDTMNVSFYRGYPYDVSTGVYNDFLNVSAQDIVPRGMAFNGNGSKVYMVGSDNDGIYEYNLSTAYDVSTGVYNDFLNVSAQDDIPAELFFNNDGSKLYMVGWINDRIYEYNLSTAYDVSTGVYNDNLYVGTQDISPTGMGFNNDGSKLYVVGDSNNRIYEYNLSTAYDVSTGTYNDYLYVGSQDIYPNAMAFNNDGSKVYMVGLDNDKIYEYNLSTAYDISTGVYNDYLDVGTQDGYPSGITFNNDGSKVYMVGSGNDGIYEYNLSTLLNTNTSVSNGTAVTYEWSGLSVNTTYDWFVEATDGTDTTTSDTWNFTTLAENPDINCGLNSGVSMIFNYSDPDATINYINLTGQNAGKSGLWCENNGTGTGNFQVKLNATEASGWVLMISNSSSFSDAIDLNTSWQTWYTGVAENGNVSAWLWANVSQSSYLNPRVEILFRAIS